MVERLFPPEAGEPEGSTPQEGDAFFERFLAPLETRMMRTVSRIVRDRELARDTLQEALATIWSQREVVCSHPCPEALMLRMCMNAAYDGLRRACRRQKHEVADGDSAESRLAQDDRALVAFDEPMARQVRAAISRLPRNQAVALLMRALDEEPYSTIARVLGCSQVSARVHVMRARIQLRRWLQHLAPGGEGGEVL